MKIIVLFILCACLVSSGCSKDKIKKVFGSDSNPPASSSGGNNDNGNEEEDDDTNNNGGSSGPYVYPSAPSNVSSSETVGATITSTFIDSPVYGLNYTTSGGGSGVTDSNGSFTCKEGERIRFYIAGRIRIGDTGCNEKIFINHLSFTADNALYEMIAILKRLDADGNNSNGIDISRLSGRNLASTLPIDRNGVTQLTNTQFDDYLLLLDPNYDKSAYAATDMASLKNAANTHLGVSIQTYQERNSAIDNIFDTRGGKAGQITLNITNLTGGVCEDLNDIKIRFESSGGRRYYRILTYNTPADETSDTFISLAPRTRYLTNRLANVFFYTETGFEISGAMSLKFSGPLGSPDTLSGLINVTQTISGVANKCVYTVNTPI